MSGPLLKEQVHNRSSRDLKRRHIKNLRRLADRIEEGKAYFREETREEYPDFADVKREGVAALLRAKADKLEAHMDAIDVIMSNEFSNLVKTIEWASTGDYCSGQVAEAWDEYDK